MSLNKSNLFLVLLFISANSFWAQTNLVPNASFETFSSCPGFSSQLYLAPPWYSPTLNSPDYFNACSSNYSVPNTGAGYQNAHSGVAFAGIYAIENNYAGCEYISARLRDPLEKDSFYCVSFYANTACGDSLYCSCNNLGVLFSADSLVVNTMGVLPSIPAFVSSSYIDDTLGWVKIEGIYRATGGEQFITIGNFSVDAQTNPALCNYVVNPPGLSAVSYYFLDDVSVVKCNLFNIQNVLTPNGDQINDVFTIGTSYGKMNCRVFDRWGRNVYQWSELQPAWDGRDSNGNNVADGVYYYVVEIVAEDGDLITKSGFIHVFNH